MSRAIYLKQFFPRKIHKNHGPLYFYFFYKTEIQLASVVRLSVF